MDIKKEILFHLLFIAIIISSGSYIFLNKSAKRPTVSTKSIKGIQTQRVISTPIPTFSPTPTLTPTPTTQPLSSKIQPTLAKQYGGWYWQSDLNRAQVWLGTDSAGKDIWIDNFLTPTPRPTPKTATQQSSTQGAISETSGFSSMGNTIQTLQTKTSEKK